MSDEHKPPESKPYKPTKDEKKIHQHARDSQDELGNPTVHQVKQMVLRDASEEAIEKLLRLATMVGRH